MADILGCDGNASLRPSGERIVAEVFVGLAKGDPSGFLRVDPTWHPDQAVARGRLMGTVGTPLQLSDLLRFAGVERFPLT